MQLISEMSRYEQKSDRAFKIIGQYPLTAATLGQVSFVRVACETMYEN